MKKAIFTLVLFFCINLTAFADEAYITSRAGILIERSTGKVLFEQNADDRLPMASVTKTMTMLLGIEAVESGKISLDDIVSVSENASSMTGSRVYLSTNEQISVSDLFKSIAVSSGNDAAVAMAEYLGRTEEKFVEMMNKKAEELGLPNTHFVNCYGLDAENHYSSARDLAVISNELLSHESIRPFLTIWMDSIRDGTFTLSNTNKLVRFYDGCTGVKTGFTSQAMYCLSASALRDEMELIAVILGGSDSKKRFADASNLLNYGFSNYALHKCTSAGDLYGEIPVDKGREKYVKIVAKESFNHLSGKEITGEIVKSVKTDKSVTAPVRCGDELGEVVFLLNDEKIGSVKLVAAEDVKKSGVFDIFNNLIYNWICI